MLLLQLVSRSSSTSWGVNISLVRRYCTAGRIPNAVLRNGIWCIPEDLIELTEKVLNKGLRPHLTTWQAKYRKWYENELVNNTEDTPQELQRRYPHYDELVDDLIKTNMRMIEYKKLMKKIAFPEK